MPRRKKKEGGKVKFVEMGVVKKGVIESYSYRESKNFGKVKMFKVNADGKTYDLSEYKIL